MTPILTLLSDRSILASVRYYGADDLATNWEIGHVLEHPEIFDTFYIDHSLAAINSLDDFALFLLTRKISNMQEMIPKLKEEPDQKKLAALCNAANGALQGLGIGPAIKFINDNYKELFSPEKLSYDIRSAAFEFAISSPGISSDVISFLCGNYGNLVIDHYESVEKRMEREPQLFETLYPSGSIRDIPGNRLKETLHIWENILSKKKSRLAAVVNNRIPDVFNEFEEMAAEATLDNILYIERDLEVFYAFLKKIKSPLANKFHAHIERTRGLVDQYVQERGHSLKYEIPVGEIIQQWDAANNLGKLLCLTHKGENTDGKITGRSILSDPPVARQLVDEIAATNIAVDEYFTFSHQQRLSVGLSVGSATLLTIICDPKRADEFFGLLLAATKRIEEVFTSDTEHLEEDVKLLIDMLSIAANNVKSETAIVNALCYGPAMLLCALTEKLLKEIYFHKVKENICTPVIKATLGDLLNPNSKEMVDLFGENHIRNLAFFFSTTGEKKIGFNYRNALAHWSDISKSRLTLSFVADLLWLFTDVLNTILLHTYE